MATIRDVAQRAGLSVATVSAVLNNKPGVSDRSEQKVRKAIKELNYRPNRVARALSRNSTNTVGMLVPSVDNPFFPQVVKSVEDVFFENRFVTLIGNTEGKTERALYYIKSMLSGWAEGLIITLTWEMTQPEVLDHLQGAGVPVVGLAGARIIPDFDAVVPDDPRGAFDAINYLIGLGHRHIGFIGVQDSESTALRLQGYSQALKEAGLPVLDELIMLGRSYEQADGYILAKALLRRVPRPTAFFCYNDVIALGAIAALHEENIRIPEEISVLGFDDTAGSYCYPQLTSVALPKTEMGFLAASLLLDRIKGKDTPPEVITVKPRLVIRDSTGPVSHYSQAPTAKPDKSLIQGVR
ncbi:MAG: LacI family transcriptional regulator [Firmicutes bacterium]|nr:LacI family transcriptional regulator [Bacillota bacterium]